MFLRPAGDKAAFISWEGAGVTFMPSPNDYTPLRHGDIVYGSSDERAIASFVVVESPDRLQPKKCVSIGNESAYGEIPSEVSAGLAGHSQGMQVICMDGAKHAALLRAAAGGRPVDPRCVVQWEALDGDEAIYLIRTPKSKDDTEGFEGSSLVVLDAETPVEYLSGVAELEIDPRMATLREKNRVIHEVLAPGYFAALPPGATVAVHELPSETADNARFAFNELFAEVEYKDEAKTIVIAVYTRRVGRDGGEKCKYTPNVWLEVGPYGGVCVWSTEDPQPAPHQGPCRRMIDLHVLEGLEV